MDWRERVLNSGIGRRRRGRLDERNGGLLLMLRGLLFVVVDPGAAIAWVAGMIISVPRTCVVGCGVASPCSRVGR